MDFYVNDLITPHIGLRSRWNMIGAKLHLIDVEKNLFDSNFMQNPDFTFRGVTQSLIPT